MILKVSCGVFVLKKKTIVLTGGGTGGHIYPALAIAGGLKSVIPSANFVFIGTNNGLEKDIIPRAGYHLEFISSAGIERKLSLKGIFALKEGLKGVGQAINHLRKIQPEVVIGTGGYVSGPVMLAAVMLGFPTAIHEQNAYPGVTNKLLNPLVKKVFLTFPEAQERFARKNNLILTGLPVRREILTAKREEALKYFGINQGDFVLTVVGGSRGARSINTAMDEVHKYFLGNEKVHIIHVTGENDYQNTIHRLQENGIIPNQNSKIYPYMHDIKHALAAADLIVGRAGASFLSEILVLGIPAILIPYPYAAENHQFWNAMSLVNVGAAKIIEDKNLHGERLLDAVLEIMQGKNKRDEMHRASTKLAKKDALEKIVSEVLKLMRT